MNLLELYKIRFTSKFDKEKFEQVINTFLKVILLSLLAKNDPYKN